MTAFPGSTSSVIDGPHKTMRRGSGVLRIPDSIGPKPVITISRQSGAGGVSFAQKLSQRLGELAVRPSTPWAVFDDNLMRVVNEEYHLEAGGDREKPDMSVPRLWHRVQEMIGLRASQKVLVERLHDTIVRLADIGHVIIVGCGANFLAAKNPEAFHVRLIGSEEYRTAHLQGFFHISREDALKMMRSRDAARSRYMKKYFHQDVGDLSYYHMVIMMDHFNYEQAVETVSQAGMAFFSKAMKPG